MKLKLSNFLYMLLICFIFVSCTKQNDQNKNIDSLDKSSKKESEIRSDVVENKKKSVDVSDSKNKIDLSNMVLIPEGEFVMGKSDSVDHHHDGHGHNDHAHHGHKNIDFGKPAHKVYLDSYYIDKHEVTNKEYYEFMKADGYNKPDFWTEEGWNWRLENNISKPNWWTLDKSSKAKSSPEYPNHPITGISWYEAMAYAKWAGKSLPTEAQWEKAAKGNNANYMYPWGIDEPDCFFANFSNEKYKFCVGSTSEVGSFENGKSPYGVYDMAGNVWEWCKDWYNADYYKVSPYKNPEYSEIGTKKVMRGGSWVNAKEFITLTYRQNVKPGLRTYFNGFRCVVENKETESTKTDIK